MALLTSYPLGLYKHALGWSRHRDANTVPTSPLADDIATAPSEPVAKEQTARLLYSLGSFPVGGVTFFFFNIIYLFILNNICVPLILVMIFA